MVSATIAIAGLAGLVARQTMDSSALSGTSTTATVSPSAFGGVTASASSSSSGSRSSSTASGSSMTTTSSVSAETTIQAIVGTITAGYAGSIIAANPCQTTLALACTDRYACGLASGLTLTMTQGPSDYILSYATSTGGGRATIKQSCSLGGPSGSWTRAVCSASIGVSAGGTSTGTSTISTITEWHAAFGYAQVPITAGASSLPSADATCTESAKGENAAGRVFGIRKVYKVLIPVVVVGAGVVL